MASYQKKDKCINVLKTDDMEIVLTEWQVSRMRQNAVTIPVNNDMVAYAISHSLHKSLGHEPRDNFKHQAVTEGTPIENIKQRYFKTLVGPTEKLNSKYLRVLSFKIPKTKAIPVQKEVKKGSGDESGDEEQDTAWLMACYDYNNVTFVTEDYKCLHIQRSQLKSLF